AAKINRPREKENDLYIEEDKENRYKIKMNRHPASARAYGHHP
ncbi:unnamed protein product, partial [marine sediment metagenome]